MGFHDLTDVHARRHAQRVEHNIHRASVGKKGHVLFGQNAGNNTLVAVASGHFVAHRKLALDGHMHLDHLDDVGRQIIAFRGLFALGVINGLQVVDLLVVGLEQAANNVIDFLALEEAGELFDRYGMENVFGQGRARFCQNFSLFFAGQGCGDLFAQHMGGQQRAGALCQRTHMVRFFLVKHGNIVLFDGKGPFVLFARPAIEHLDVNDDALHTRRNLEGGVFYITGLFAEDGPQEFFFRRELRFSLGSDFSHQDVVRLNSRPDADDAAFVKIAQHFFADIGNVAGDFFRAELCVAGDNLKLFNMDGRENVFLDGTFGNEDGVLIVIAAPRHEGDHKVLSQGQFSVVNAGAVSKDLALAHNLARMAGRLLAEAGILVGLVVLQQIMDAHAALFGMHIAVVGDHNAIRIHILHNSVSRSHKACPRVVGDIDFHARAHQGFFRAQQRHSLALHVGSHKGAVRVIVLKERNESRRNGHHLAGRNIHERDFVPMADFDFTLDPDGHKFVNQHALFVQSGIGLGHDLIPFARCVEVHDFVGKAAIAHNAVRRFDEAEIVHLGKGRQGNDQADVRPFRRFDGADAPVVGGMHVANLKARPFAGQPAGAQSRQAPLVRHLRKRVGLVHELRQLGCAKKLLEHSCHRLGIDQVVRHERGNFLQAHAFLDGPFHAHEADAVLVFHQFPHKAHTAVAEVVNIVCGAVAVLQLHEHLDGRENILVGQGAHVFGLAQGKALVELVAAHGGEVVIVGIAEQIVKKVGRNLGSRGRGGAQTAVDFFLGLLLVGDAVLHQGVADGGGNISPLGVQHGHALNARLAHALQQALSDFVGGFRQNFSAFGVGNVFAQKHAVQYVRTHGNGLNARLADEPPGALGDGLARLDDDVSGGIGDIRVGIVLAVQFLADFPGNV